ncbi:hypothetical protein BDM02DRAFT_3119414 [Thelephora ganbajun]|uniref:Uncharacterized protein n=1 Tax=Thelephora ganbajun TaxID=370292 RepID=A0ACB6Z8J3_THEGA|nr:hypothetical protein BDM02DRAFT_3119414 [Thelephora ganbajun]
MSLLSYSPQSTCRLQRDSSHALRERLERLQVPDITMQLLQEQMPHLQVFHRRLTRLPW